MIRYRPIVLPSGDSMAYDAKAIANHFLKIAAEQGQRITPMQMLKLVYFAHGWHLALTGEPLINELVEAWEYGPVIPSLYHEFKKFGNQPIIEDAISLRADGMKLYMHRDSLDDETDLTRKEFVDRLLRRVWENYGKLNGIQLSKLTHLHGSPWDATRRKGDNANLKGVDIPNEEIREYFTKLLHSDGTSQS